MERASPPSTLVGPPPQIDADTFRRRRQQIAVALGDGHRLVVATHPETTYSNDVHHRFRPHSDLWYLTGCPEPEAVLVLEGGTGRSDLFVRPRKPEAEIWTGRRLGVERAAEALGVDKAHGVDELPGFLRTGADGVATSAIVGHAPSVAERVANAVGVYEDGRPLLAAARMRKDAQEIVMLQQAADVAVAAHLAAYCEVAPGRSEHHVDAALGAAFRAAGSTGPGYPSIVGGGANAAVLHYIENQAPLRAGEMILIDAGCEWGYYNSDITRTLPIDGSFTADQARLYDIVAEAQQAAIDQVRPGNRLLDPHRAAVRVVATGLADLGWLDGDVDDIIENDGHRRFYMHGTSHFLGLDVHDVGTMKDEDGESRRLEPGMVITVEPGLYANPDFTTLPPGVAPFGIRIENDIVVTDEGHHDLTAALPTRREAVEALVGDRPNG